MSLNAFLSQNVKKVDEIEVVVSDRFMDEDGKVVPFKLIPITAEQDEKIKEQCTIQKIGKNGKPDVKFDSVAYGRKMTVATVSYPNLNSEELQNSYGVMSGEELLPIMLLPGEYAQLQKRVQEVNGFKTFQELEDEAKN